MALTRPRYSQIYDTDYKQSVTVATTGDVGNVYASSLTNTIDGVTLTYLDRILVKDQTDSKQNGIYEVLVVGTGANGTWRRSLDTNTDDKVTSGLRTIVSAGSVNIGKEFRLITADPITVGVTGLAFADIAANPIGANTQVQFNDAGVMGASPSFTFNKSGNILTVANLTITSNTSANIVSFTASGTQSNIGFVINPKNYGYVSISGNTGLVIPTGTTAQQAPAVTGAIRFNTSTSQFEGFGGTSWSSLGGVRSVDGLTYITAELTTNSSDDTLHFYASNNTDAVEVAKLSTGNLTVNIATASTSTTTGALIVGGGAGIGGNVNAGSLTTPGSRHTFAGNLAVTGVNGSSDILSVTDNSSVPGATKALSVKNGVQNVWISANVGQGSWNGINQVNDMFIGFSGTAQGVGNLTIAPWSSTTSGLRFRTDINQITSPGQFVISNNTVSTTTTSGALTVAGGVGIAGNVNIGGNLIVVGNMIVQGTTTTVNSTTLDVADLNITVAKGAVNAAAANGAGLTVDGAGATFTYASSTDSWTLNKGLNVSAITTSTSTSSGALIVGGGAGVAGNLYVGGGLAVGTTLNTWNTSSTVEQFPGGALESFSTTAFNVYQNLYRDTSNSNRYITSNPASWYNQGSGTHNFYVVPTGTAGGLATSFTNALSIANDTKITASGQLVVSNTVVSTSNVTGAVTVSGGIGVGGNLYVGKRVGFVYGNAVSAVYQVYNQTTGSLDTVFG